MSSETIFFQDHCLSNILSRAYISHPPFWPQDVNWTYIRYEDSLLNVLYTLNLRPVPRGKTSKDNDAEIVKQKKQKKEKKKQ